MVGTTAFRTLADAYGDLGLVVWVPDANLLEVDDKGQEKTNQTLRSLEDFKPEEWGLPPYDGP